jgi:hypothetical protein
MRRLPAVALAKAGCLWAGRELRLAGQPSLVFQAKAAPKREGGASSRQRSSQRNVRSSAMRVPTDYAARAPRRLAPAVVYRASLPNPASAPSRAFPSSHHCVDATRRNPPRPERALETQRTARTQSGSQLEEVVGIAPWRWWILKPRCSLARLDQRFIASPPKDDINTSQHQLHLGR